MTLEEEFYKEVTPEGRNNYVLSGQAKVLLSLCKAIDELRAAEQSMQRTGGESGKQNLFSAGGVLPAKVTQQSTRR